MTPDKNYLLTVSYDGDEVTVEGPEFLIDELGNHLRRVVGLAVRAGLTEEDVSEQVSKALDEPFELELSAKPDGHGTFSVNLSDKSDEPLLLARCIIVLSAIED